ncbi:MAG: 50S ribosomal protein L23 [Gammaproteobacteria bacterium]|nr:50S ribosomal protein L23 [Gammaproteobacteria bacterium]
MREELFTILRSPHVSEKATRLADKHRQFVFEVALPSNKETIKQAVEMLFEVKVAHVRVVNVKPKQKRFGTMMGQRKKWKKAYVTLQEGHDINFAGNQ